MQQAALREAPSASCIQSRSQRLSRSPLALMSSAVNGGTPSRFSRELDDFRRCAPTAVVAVVEDAGNAAVNAAVSAVSSMKLSRHARSAFAGLCRREATAARGSLPSCPRPLTRAASVRVITEFGAALAANLPPLSPTLLDGVEPRDADVALREYVLQRFAEAMEGAQPGGEGKEGKEGGAAGATPLRETTPERVSGGDAAATTPAPLVSAAEALRAPLLGGSPSFDAPLPAPPTPSPGLAPPKPPPPPSFWESVASVLFASCSERKGGLATVKEHEHAEAPASLDETEAEHEHEPATRTLSSKSSLDVASPRAAGPSKQLPPTPLSPRLGTLD